jgi:hypothetical protein
MIAMPSSAAGRRLQQVEGTLRPQEAAATTSTPITSAERPLTDSQLKTFVECGLLALHPDELGQDWHASIAEQCYNVVFADGQTTPCPGPESRGLPGKLESLTELVSSPTVSGALTSLLGQGWLQHPNRMLQHYGNADNTAQEYPTGDQTWRARQTPDGPPPDYRLSM